MAWETRKGRGAYYTRSRREGSKVIREYYGGGIIGQEAARQDAEARRRLVEQRQRQKEHEQEMEALQTPIDEKMSELNQVCRLWVRFVLEEAGFFQHNRGDWRKKRG